jgi:hypothetical protein
MTEDEITSPAGDEAGEPTGAVTESSEPVTEPTAESTQKPGWTRRAFFWAAALAAAAFVPSTAWANDLSTDSCTANDVQINSPGFVLNEPCSCPAGSTFTAMVAFPVFNNTATNRYCVALHLIPATLPNGTVFAPPDIILIGPDGTSTLPGGKVTTTMIGTIAMYPCNAGLICFGQAGVTSGKCLPGTCSTIAWNTSTGDANCTTADQSPSPGQCRHQQICIQGYGAALTCKSNCTPTCGGTSVLTASASGGNPPYTYTLMGSDGTSHTCGPTSASCDFSVTVTKNTTYTLTVTDTKGCTRMATTSLNASSLSQPTLAAGTPACDGTTTFTASPSGLADYKFTIDSGTAVDNGTNNVYTTKLALGQTHSASVTVANSSGCTATSSTINVTVNAAVAVSGATTSGPSCTSSTTMTASVTLTASASGGAGGFTFQWFDGSTSIGTSNPLMTTLAPGDHYITVKATDSASCVATSAGFTVHVNQPVSVSGALTGGPDCTGKVTLTATPSGGTGTYSSFQWFDGSTSLGTTTTGSLTTTLAPGDHSITVTVTDSAGCTGTSAAVPVHVNQPVSTSLNTGSTPDCTGHLTFTASATGGTGSYTYAWTIDGTLVSGVTGNTLAYTPTVDCKLHTVAVTATDSAGCVSGNTASRTAAQVVTTTVN